jgi:hypothetical protein
MSIIGRLSQSTPLRLIHSAHQFRRVSLCASPTLPRYDAMVDGLLRECYNSPQLEILPRSLFIKNLGWIGPVAI